MAILNFFKTILKTTNPMFYKDLSRRDWLPSIRYFLLVLLLTTIIIFALFIPKIFLLPKVAENELGKFSKFDVSLDIKTRAPLTLPSNNPEVIIDTSADYNLTKGRVLVAEDKIIAKRGFCFLLDPLCFFYKEKTKEYKFSDYKDVTKVKNEFSRFLTILMILASPSILAVLYIFLLLKYVVAILIVALIAFVASKMMRVDAGFFEVIKSAVYASTIPLALEIINMAFNLKLYYVLLLVYLLFVLVVVYFIGEKASDSNDEA